MISCVICGDTNGPWIRVNDLGFVCEECTRDKEKYENKLRKNKRANKKKR